MATVAHSASSIRGKLRDIRRLGLTSSPPSQGSSETGRPRQNRWNSLRQIPATTAESDAFSRDLKHRGFSFVGPTVIYAHMQAVGMVNDHVVDCYRYRDVRRLRTPT